MIINVVETGKSHAIQMKEILEIITLLRESVSTGMHLMNTMSKNSGKNKDAMAELSNTINRFQI